MYTDEPSGLDNIIVRPVYLRAVNAIVQPEVQVPCSLYFFQKWLPRLGVLRWSMVLALRTLCSQRQPDGTSRGEICRADLANALGVHEATISRVLNTAPSSIHPGWRVLKPLGANDTETPWLAKFIPRLRYKYQRDAVAGVTRRVGYIIDVVMDDPLGPEDEERLAVLIAEEVLQTLPASPGVKTADASQHRREVHQASDAPENDSPALSGSRAQKSATRQVKSQDALLHDRVKEQINSDTSAVERQNASSHKSVNKQEVPYSVTSKRNRPPLTLTCNYTYRDIVIDLSLVRKRDIRVALTPLVDLAAELLNDHHSKGMFFSTLTQLYPANLDLFTQALEAAEREGQLSRDINMGVVFVHAIRQATGDAGVELRLGKASGSRNGGDHDNLQPEPEQARAVSNGTTWNEMANMPGTGVSAKQMWPSVLQELRGRTTKPNYEMWLRNCEMLGVDGDVVVLGVPSVFARDWISERLISVIERTLRDVTGKELRARCEVKQRRGSRV